MGIFKNEREVHREAPGPAQCFSHKCLYYITRDEGMKFSYLFYKMLFTQKGKEKTIVWTFSLTTVGISLDIGKSWSDCYLQPCQTSDSVHLFCKSDTVNSYLSDDPRLSEGIYTIPIYLVTCNTINTDL